MSPPRITRYPAPTLDQLHAVLSPSEISAIVSSYSLMEPLSEAVARRFYERLFELDPSLRGLFHGDMRTQGQKLMDMLGFIAANLHDPAKLTPAVQELGRRHAGYRVEPRHYATVGEALLGAMASVLGPQFSKEAAKAWEKAYRLLSDIMIDAQLAAARD